MRTGKSKLVLIVIAAILIVILLPLGFVLMSRPTTPVVNLPTPNGYDALDRAASMVKGLPEDYAGTLDRESLESFVADNAEAIDLVEQAIEQQFVLPINYEADMQAAMDLTGSIRLAMRLMHVNARVAELEGDKAREAMRYAWLFALSNKSANGGLMVHSLTAAANERLALNRLVEIAEQLDAPQKRKVLALVSSVNRQPAGVDQILERERILVKKEHGTVFGSWMIWATRQNSLPAIQRFIQTDAEIVELHRQAVERLP